MVHCKEAKTQEASISALRTQTLWYLGLYITCASFSISPSPYFCLSRTDSLPQALLPLRFSSEHGAKWTWTQTLWSSEPKWVLLPLGCFCYIFWFQWQPHLLHSCTENSKCQDPLQRQNRSFHTPSVSWFQPLPENWLNLGSVIEVYGLEFGRQIWIFARNILSSDKQWVEVISTPMIIPNTDSDSCCLAGYRTPACRAQSKYQRVWTCPVREQHKEDVVETLEEMQDWGIASVNFTPQ